MKHSRGNAKKQRESDDTKTKPPHSIVSSAVSSPKILNIAKKSQTIIRKADTPRTAVQSKLIPIKNANGTKSLVVAKADSTKKLTNLATVGTTSMLSKRIINYQKPATVKVEPKVERKPAEIKKTVVEPKTSQSSAIKVIKSDDAAHSSKETSPNKLQYGKKIVCKYCSLHFANSVWLEKHINRCHLDIKNKQQKVVTTSVVPNYQKQIEKTKEVLHQVTKKCVEQSTAFNKTLAKQQKLKEKPKPIKKSPGKSFLRQQLKIQLDAQRKLLQVQQQIFEKANKAQEDIYKLIAELGNDSDLEEAADEDEEAEEEEEEEGEEEEEEEEEQQQQQQQQQQKQQQQQQQQQAEEEFLVEPEPELTVLPPRRIKADKAAVKQIVQYEEVPHIDSDTLFLDEPVYDANVTVSDEYIVLNNQIPTYNENEYNYVEQHENDENVMVVVQTDDGTEEFELFEVVEDPLNATNSGVDVEIVSKDIDGDHFRIVSNEQPYEETGDQIVIDSGEIKTEKSPIKVEIGNLPIFNNTKYVPQKGSKQQTKGERLLNKKIKTDKETNEYIQNAVKNAVQKDGNKFECPLCRELVSNRYSLGPHILRVHSKQKSKICPHCDRAFTCTGDLTRHIRIHTGDKPFKCTYPNCTYAFRASGDLHKHLRRHNSSTVNIRQHVCTLCDRAFERNYDLKRHELTHKKNVEGIGYSCEFCPKRFVRKDQHKAHIYRHLGIRPFKCPDCDRQFGDFSNCSKHIKQCQAGESFGSEVINENIPHFICDICHKRFKSKIGIQQHVVKCSKTTREQRKLQLAMAMAEEAA